METGFEHILKKLRGRNNKKKHLKSMKKKQWEIVKIAWKFNKFNWNIENLEKKERRKLWP